MAIGPTILQIIPRLDTGGAELATIEITEALTRAGGRSLVATAGGRLADRITESGGEIITFPAGTKNPLALYANARALTRIIREQGVDLIHARSRAPAWSALLAARQTGIPFVTTYHGAYAERGGLKRLYNSVMARADIVIANSTYTGDLIKLRYGTPEQRIRVIHRGVDLATFRPEAVSAERVAARRQAWGVGLGVPVILQAARLTGWKGQGVLIDAAAQLQKRGQLGSAIVILAGDAQGRDGYGEDLRQQAAAAGIGDLVRLVGHIDDVAAAYLAAHVTVVASVEPEAFGRAAIEAMAMGSPVIATAIGAPPETIAAEPRVSTADVTGWLVPPGDAGALAERLVMVLGMPEAERKAIGDRARAHVASRFTLENMKRATLAVYDELLGRGLEQRFLAATESTAMSARQHPQS